MGIWIVVNISIKEINLGFISNEHHRWSNKKEGIPSSTKERMCSLRHRVLRSPRTDKMKYVVSRLHTWSTREFHLAYLKFSGPALNCHVCSYMNDKGKCLRGESVCSTQNTQQYMLKKIFEGMWGLQEVIFVREHNQLEYWWGVGCGGQGPEERSSCGSQKLGDWKTLSRIKSRIPATDGEVETIPSRPVMS